MVIICSRLPVYVINGCVSLLALDSDACCGLR